MFGLYQLLFLPLLAHSVASRFVPRQWDQWGQWDQGGQWDQSGQWNQGGQWDQSGQWNQGGQGTQGSQGTGQACNNSPTLCSKTYDQISHLGAHNSPFLRDASTGFSSSGNQFYNTTVQLDSGVRLLSAQMHEHEGEQHLCHTSCSLMDAGRLRDWLSEIKEWMDKNPNDVVTIILVNSDEASPEVLDAEFKEAKLDTYAYKPTDPVVPPSPWPSLQTLINAKTRLLVFVTSLGDSGVTTAPYLMQEFNFIFETPFEVVKPEEFTCAPHRPSQLQNKASDALSSGRLSFVNHFLGTEGGLGIVSPNVEKIKTTNSPGDEEGALGSFVKKCRKEYWNRGPTFVLVDFFDQGPAIKTIDELNGVTEVVGRKPVPDSNSEALQMDGRPPRDTGRMFRGLSDLLEVVKSGTTPSLGNWIWVGGDWGSLVGGGVAVG
ncbi:hypothetical protein AJ79_07620 [Helicocarpus griseus UAMH5409]|uniref:Phosphatidylinositol-specific phospholipase C X domain-containing protein n=1 Tax=Helicocarpus griseus UAMH5409 TaxID=1447875 RepID=A0A2B7X121_9EURO|nr:hypothetical protein AJ79_07620 [Helicocarpus griseus UAMH5409]